MAARINTGRLEFLANRASAAVRGTLRRVSQRFRRLTWWAGVAALVLVVVAPLSAPAHGELLIRINEVTRRIAAATNANDRLAPLHVERGELHREHESWEEAEADFDRAAELDPNLVAVDFGRGKLRANTGQLEAARELFDKVLARSPNDGEALVERARVFVRLHQPQPAMADFQRGAALLAEPDPAVFVEWAQVLVTEGRTNEALRALDAGIRKLGPLPPMQTFALDLEVQRQNYAGALQRLETLLARAMRKENWQARRGDILLAAGRPAEAKASYEAALETIKALPLRIQQGPAMTSLQAHVQAALAGLSNVTAGDPKPAP